MSIIDLKDQNGKVISCDISKNILEVYDDYGLETNNCFTKIDDNEKTGAFENKTLQVIDSNGKAFVISDSENNLDDITNIEVHIEATHSDRVINSAKYTSESMLRDAVTYIHPFNKPFLKNHYNNSEPLGRIISSECIDSAIVEGTKAVNIVANITDKDAIPKFIDKRYSTVSIGARPRTITCLHCGKHILKDGKFKFCGHWRGETYEDKICLWKMEDLEYSELSVVNSPADKYAQVYKIVVHRKSDKNKSEDSEKNSLIINNDDPLANSILVSDNKTEEEKEEASSYEIESLKDQIKNLGELINSLQSENEKLLEKNRELEDKCDLYSVDCTHQGEKISKISNMYRNDILEIVNMAKDNNSIFSEDTPFNVLKDNLKVFKENYKKNINGNNLGDTSKIPTSPTTPKAVINPGLVDNSDKEKVIEDNGETYEEDKEEYSIDNILSTYLK